uniref:C3H1-type domain-containing protein n=1 Tax=Brassica campestris TaxID=3711 RepID=M4CEZ8_BRACM
MASRTCLKNKSAPSKEAKARKKLFFMLGRKELNSVYHWGVKKLKPVARKPKPTKFCRYYLKGPCHEGGDTCKFSHDATPETKSLPCCHFAKRTELFIIKQNAQNSGNSELEAVTTENLCSFGASKRDQFLII